MSTGSHHSLGSPVDGHSNGNRFGQFHSSPIYINSSLVSSNRIVSSNLERSAHPAHTSPILANTPPVVARSSVSSPIFSSNSHSSQHVKPTPSSNSTCQVPSVVSQLHRPCHTSTQFMVTRSKAGVFKPKSFLTSIIVPVV